MLKDMALIAVECLKNPRRRSIWAPAIGKYVCPVTKEGQQALGQEIKDSFAGYAHLPTVDPQFKLVFLTAAGGTILFVTLCVVLTLFAGRDPPSLLEKVVSGLFDLAKIGFGAAVGLLGGKELGAQRTSQSDRAPSQQDQAGQAQASDPKK
jgi:hypothetical protein